MMPAKESLKDAAKRTLAFVRSGDAFENKGSKIAGIFICCLWLAVVIFITTRHEFWRDEVRALSLARAATSLPDLFSLIQYDGHPILWYLLLYVETAIVDTPLVLPVTSITIAFTAVAVFVFFSPFPFWMRCLFIFSALPLYEYSVMARNYGISMLLLFVFAALYRYRNKHPLLLAAILAFLANTIVHSVAFVCLITAFWAWDTIVDRKTSSIQTKSAYLFLAFAIVSAGVILCVVTTLPGEKAMFVTAHDAVVKSINLPFLEVLSRPWNVLSFMLPKKFPHMAASLLFLMVALGLLHRPSLFLSAIGAQVAFGYIFCVLHRPNYRQQGLLMVFLIFLYWIFIESLKNKKAMNRTKKVLYHAGLYIAMTLLILGNVAKTKDKMWADIKGEVSSGKAFGEFLRTSEAYRDAIIVPEPDYVMESLPYYAKNRIYLPRELRFGNTVSWTTESDRYLSLGDLLSMAQDLKKQHGQPVLIVIGHRDFHSFVSCEMNIPCGRFFTWDVDEKERFDRMTRRVKKFTSARGDENYAVYVLK